MLGNDSSTKAFRNRAFQAITVPQPPASTKAGYRRFKVVLNKPDLHARRTADTNLDKHKEHWH